MYKVQDQGHICGCPGLIPLQDGCANPPGSMLLRPGCPFPGKSTAQSPFQSTQLSHVLFTVAEGPKTRPQDSSEAIHTPQPLHQPKEELMTVNIGQQLDSI